MNNPRRVIKMETLKYQNILPVISLQKMTIDQMIAGMLDRHRERYAYHLIGQLGLKDMQRNALLYISNLEERNPDWDLADIRGMLERESTASYEKRLEKARGTELYGSHLAELGMVKDANFREDMIALYQEKVRPGLEQFESYDEQLQELTREFVYTLSGEELRPFTILYGKLRETGDDERDDFLKEIKPEYAELMERIDAFEQQYRHLIEKDIVNVRENIHKDLFCEPLDKEADALKQEKYGILFPYLHLAKTLYTFVNTGTTIPYGK